MENKVIYVNAGSGNSVVATISDKKILIDCGDIPRRQESSYNDELEPKGDNRLSTNNNSEYAIENVREALASIGVNKGGKIDYFVASHGDGDHIGNAYVNDNEGLLTEYQIGEYIQPAGELEALENWVVKLKGKSAEKAFKNVVALYKNRLNYLKNKGVRIKSYGNGEYINLGNGNYIRFFNDKLTGDYHNEKYDYSYWYTSTGRKSVINGYTLPSEDIVKVDVPVLPNNRFDRVPSITREATMHLYFHKISISKLKSSAYPDCPYQIQSCRNAYSLVIQLKFDGYRHMITGDANVKELDTIAKKWGDELKSDVCAAAHHGSSQSASVEFMNLVNPYKWINQLNRYRQEAVRKGSDYYARYYQMATSTAGSWYNVCDCVRYQKDDLGLVFTKENPFFIPELDRNDRSYLQYLHNHVQELPRVFTIESWKALANARQMDNRHDDSMEIKEVENAIYNAYLNLTYDIESKEEYMNK